MERRTRTVAKSLTWRITALLITSTVVWVVTGKVELAASIGLLDTAIKLGAYYVHERCWLKVSYGRIRAPEYEI